MLERSYKLRQVCSLTFLWTQILMCTQPITLFLKIADALYGPITTIRRNGRIVKKIPWSAFIFINNDWERVKNASDILKVFHFICTSWLSDSSFPLCRIQMIFSNISPRNSFRHFGEHFQSFKNYKRHGKQSGTLTNSHFIRTLSMMAWASYRNIILAWTASQQLFLHSVCFFFRLPVSLLIIFY